jgi:plastocyanin
MQFSVLALAALTAVASAQDMNGTPTVAVTVGMNKTLTFSPNNLKVAAGTAVQFQFVAGNHTVSQSTFDQPCQPVSMFSNVTGVNSGFMPVSASMASGQGPVFTMMVMDTKPMWLYCAQGNHCESGMVMVINEK